MVELEAFNFQTEVRFLVGPLKLKCVRTRKGIRNSLLRSLLCGFDSHRTHTNDTVPVVGLTARPFKPMSKINREFESHQCHTLLSNK